MDNYLPDDLQYSDDIDDSFQYVDDINDDINDDFCVMDLETQKIDLLTEKMYDIKKQLNNFDDTKLNNLDNIKRDFYFLCENNRYLIDDSTLLQKLEIYIYENISIYEDKLSKIYEELVDKEDELIKKEIIEKEKAKAKEKAKIDHDKFQKEFEKITSYSFYKLNESKPRDNSRFKNIIELRNIEERNKTLNSKLSDSK